MFTLSGANSVDADKAEVTPSVEQLSHLVLFLHNSLISSRLGDKDKFYYSGSEFSNKII